ncbi:RNA methyltransferase [Methylotenera sp.]|uniref:RNA methyltransferase n=1 Tax=Methylotenera sp. TaxID=2051956 RepID=UPI0027309CAB|nr:RNA methyltransferase [Methylotenera sp.]MDP2231202.1 RNA methyltransferase [Methylotenera sp.]MDP3140072.1 RNA methyltransferase [Methylotenera sp.]
MTSKLDSTKLHTLHNFRVVLCQTSHPGNIGSAARAMKTMGISQLYLVKPDSFPDAHATALSTGAADLLENAVVTETLAEALTGCAFAIGLSARKRGLSHELVNVRTAATKAIEIAATQPVALVFGTEMSGLSNAELDHCQMLAMIQANPEYSSLNLAAAVQVMCYELRMAALDENTISPNVTSEYATIDSLEGFYAHLEETLLHIGYLNPAAPKKLMERLRRIYARVRLEKEEVNLLRGILTLTVTPRKHDKY